MTVKETLKQARRARGLYKALLASYLEARADAYSIKSPKLGERVQTSHQSDLAEVVEKLERYAENVKEQLGEVLEMTLQAERIINTEQDRKLRGVLYDYYINGKTWEKIAVDLGITYRHVQRLHGQALEDVRKKFP